MYSPLNLANKKSQKLKFVRNSAPDNHRVLNFTRNPYWRIYLYNIWTMTYLSLHMYMTPQQASLSTASLLLLMSLASLGRHSLTWDNKSCNVIHLNSADTSTLL